MSTHDQILANFTSLISEAESVLQECGWNGRTYRDHPSTADYFRFRTEARNLVRRVCGQKSDHYLELSRLANSNASANNPFFYVHCLGVLQAAHRDFSKGFLFDLRELIAAELLGDFMEQAEVLLATGYQVPAASLAGAVLEDILRRLCIARQIPHSPKTRIGTLNSDLARANAYSLLIQKRITALADIRNSADHGHFDKVLVDDVADMIKWIRKFAADHLK